MIAPAQSRVNSFVICGKREVARVRLRIVCLLLLGTPAATGQAFEYLATDRTGSVLYFSSPLRLKNTDEPPYAKIFRWSEDSGVRLYAQQKEPGVYDSVRLWGSLTAYRLITPLVSSAGDVVAFTGRKDCNWGSLCHRSIELFESTIRIRGAAEMRVPGAVTISPNGRYAVLTTSIASPRPITRFLDLQTGGFSDFQGFSVEIPGAHGVSNDGTVATTGGGLGLWRAGELRKLFAGLVQSAMINDSATRVVYEQISRGLFSYDIQTRRETQLLTGNGPFSFAISDDASRIAYIDSGQAWIVNHDGGGRRQIAQSPDEVRTLTLSGDGSIVFAVTASNRIIRIRLSPTVIDEIVPATSGGIGTYGPTFGRFAVPGSLFGVNGRSIVDEVCIYGRACGIPTLFNSPSALFFQIPWDLPEDPKATWIELDLPDNPESPFDSFFVMARPIWIRRFAPQFFTEGPELDVIAAHEDFSSLVTMDNPARAGEVIHIYGIGFGPVVPQPPSGSAAPIEPLSFVTDSMACEL
ncbi:MAG: hypothetical protein HYZ57_19995, partial [Acidobacteria bacterium]|nr:hypothetical protein [Acidobacteriota bacterium]